MDSYLEAWSSVLKEIASTSILTLKCMLGNFAGFMFIFRFFSLKLRFSKKFLKEEVQVRLKVSSNRLVKPEIGPVIPGPEIIKNFHAQLN